jgi:hypothetical protein
MSKNLENNFSKEWNENEWKKFNQELNDFKFREAIRKESTDLFSKAIILNKKINELIKKKIIREEDNIANVFDIIEIELKNNEGYKNFEEMEKTFNLVKTNLLWFLEFQGIRDDMYVGELLSFLKNTIEESRDFLKNG